MIFRPFNLKYQNAKYKLRDTFIPFFFNYINYVFIFIFIFSSRISISDGNGEVLLKLFLFKNQSIEYKFRLNFKLSHFNYPIFKSNRDRSLKYLFSNYLIQIWTSFWNLSSSGIKLSCTNEREVFKCFIFWNQNTKYLYIKVIFQTFISSNLSKNPNRKIFASSSSFRIKLLCKNIMWLCNNHWVVYPVLSSWIFLTIDHIVFF